MSDRDLQGMAEIRVVSTLDSSEEAVLFHAAEGDSPRPLLVGLHTWSFDRFNQIDAMLPLAKRHNWHLLLPEFRGPNTTANPRPAEACGSRLAMQDVVDAVAHVQILAAVDDSAILLAGASGGGHMALMMAGYKPELWRTVAAFVGITDLAQWRHDAPRYAPHVEACCGGAPGDDTVEEYAKRSPMTHAQRIARAELTIFHGKYDPTVPFTHATRLYDAVNAVDPASRVFLRVFDGGHEMPLHMLEAHLLDALAQTPEAQQVTG